MVAPRRWLGVAEGERQTEAGGPLSYMLKFPPRNADAKTGAQIQISLVWSRFYELFQWPGASQFTE